MTREEAIEFGNTILMFAEQEKDSHTYEFTKMAVEALSAEPCEDCISREAVLDMVEDMTDQFGNKHRVVTEGMISLLPPVTPKPKTDVLDKIRAEIEEYSLLTRERVIGIIDKYKSESEDKE